MVAPPEPRRPSGDPAAPPPPADLAAFAASLRAGLPGSLDGGTGATMVARAPVRIDVLGGDAAFAGAMTLQSLGEDACLVAARRCDEPRMVVQRDGAEKDAVAWPVDELLAGARSGKEALAHPWAAPFALALPALAPRLGGRLPPGFRLLVRSNVACGGGAALATACIAAVRAIAPLLDVTFAPRELVGVALAAARRLDPALDAAAPLAITEGDAGRLLPVLCQPGRSFDPLDLPDGVLLHAVALPASPERDRSEAAARAAFRAAVAIGYRLMAAQMGLTVHTQKLGEPQEVEDPYFEGYLANVDPVTFAGEFRDRLPEELEGVRFLDAHGGVADRHARVDAAARYAVRACTLHVIAEHQRACAFIDALHRAAGERPDGDAGDPGDAGDAGDGRPGAAATLGALFEQSYLSARGVGLVPADADVLITELRRRGAAKGVLGARATADPGVVAVLLRADERARRSLDESVAAYERKFGSSPRPSSGTSPGAAARNALVRV